MKIIKKPEDLQSQILEFKKKRKTIGFVPTMGSLHAGHLSLIQRARRENDVVIVSIFVNPLQFGPHDDFSRYPRNLKKDRSFLKGFADIVFVPSAAAMVPSNTVTTIKLEELSTCLCGKSRPGHFQGVAMIVAKLFNLVQCDSAYFGQKDFQQAVIVKKMVEDLNFPVNVKVLPIVRSCDGLALSSRNQYLSQGEREDALVLFQSLCVAAEMAQEGLREVKKIKKSLINFIKRRPLVRIDYIEIVNPETLAPIKTLTKGSVLLLAAYIGSTRLIDNVILKVPRSKDF